LGRARQGETCLDRSRRLGDTYGLAIDPPDAPSKDQPRAPSSRVILAQSRSVARRDASVISPPRTPTSHMPDGPKVAPDSKSKEAPARTGLSAADLKHAAVDPCRRHDQAPARRERRLPGGLQKARRLLRDSK